MAMMLAVSLDFKAKMSRITTSTQDYLKAIYTLCDRHGRAATNDLAEMLNIRPASVSNMLQKLAAGEPALVEYRKHRGVTLTSAGQEAAIRVIRRHRLVETYLVEKLGYSWDEVHEEAEQLEHVISAKLVARIDEALGFPSTDPHGHPIPSADLAITATQGSSLAAAAGEATLIIRRIGDADSELLTYLESQGVKPGITIFLLERTTDGVVHILIPATGQRFTLTEEQAGQVTVSPAT